MHLGVVFLFVKLLGYVSLRITHMYNHTHNNPTYIIDKISLTDHGSFVHFFSNLSLIFKMNNFNLFSSSLTFLSPAKFFFQ